MVDVARNGGDAAMPAAVVPVPDTSARGVWPVALARWRWVLAVVACALGIAAVHIWRTQPIYAAKLTVRIDPTPNPIADAQAFAPTYDYRVDPLASEQQVIRSRTIATRTVRALGIPTGLSLADAAEDFQTRILTRVLPETDIIEMTLVGPDSAWDRRAADTLTEVYAAYSREQAQIRARGRSQFIAQSLTDQAAALARSQDSLRAFQTAHQTSDVGDEETEVFKRIYKFASDRGELALEQSVYLALVGTLARTDTTDDELRRLAATDAVVHNRSVAGLYDSWTDLERTRQRLLLSRTDRNADVQALDSSIASTKRGLERASSLYLASLGARIASLDSSMATLRHQTERFPPMVSEQARLAAIVKTRETEYNALLGQFQVARISEGGETGGVRVLDAAVVSPTPLVPNPPRALLIAVIVGLVLGVGAAAAVDRLDDSVRTPEEVRDRFQVPVLAVIPRGAGGGDRGAVRLATHADPQSPVAEAFRSLRTSLSFTRAHAEPRTLVVASAGPGEGKSTVAANLGIAFAQQGQRTLIIDADLRRAVMYEVFGVAAEPGLSEVLVGRARLGDVVRSGAIPDLAIVTSGRVPPNPAELLGSSTMRAVIEEARGMFDMVIVDAPPVLAVTDPAVIASLVDGAILVVRAGASSRDGVHRAIAQLRGVHARLLGIVLNDVSRRQAGYGTYGRYYAPRRASLRTGWPRGLPRPRVRH
jgi:capsular exopolysaccharide synthesis family protein